MLQPEHCAPAQHKPKILNNELTTAQAAEKHPGFGIIYAAQGRQAKQLSNNTKTAEAAEQRHRHKKSKKSRAWAEQAGGAGGN